MEENNERNRFDESRFVEYPDENSIIDQEETFDDSYNEKEEYDFGEAPSDSADVKSSYSYYDTGSTADAASDEEDIYAAAGRSNNAYRSTADSKIDKKKKSKPMSLKRKLATTVALALVFGLVGGSVFYGVNYIGNRYLYNVTDSASAGQDANAAVSGQEVSSSASIGTTMDGAAADTETTAKLTVPSGSSAAMSVEEVTQKCMPSVVTIASVSTYEMQTWFGQTQQYQAEGAGSGVIVGQNDTELLIATNNHVVKNATELSVGFIDESTAEAYIKGTDSANDLAVIAVKLDSISEETKNQIKVATIGSSDDLQLGEGVVVLGNALGYGQSVTSGVVSAVDREMTFEDSGYTVTSTGLIQTDAPINAGNSGGGLFNMEGELIGINEGKSSMTSSGMTVDGIGFAISISKAEPILEDLMSRETKEKVAEDEQGYLGVSCKTVTSDIVEAYNMPAGVCFMDVVEGGPAANAGVKKGDVLISLDDYEITDYESLTTALSYYKAGETVTLTIMRADDGEYVETQLSVTLGSKDVIEKYQTQG